MEYRAQVITFIKNVAKELGIEGSMYNIINRMKTEHFNPNNELCNKIISFLNSENIEKLNINVYKILNPEANIEDIPFEELDSYTLNKLSPEQLINYFGLVFYGITFWESEDLLLLKYNKCIYNTGWFNFALKSRGVVLDKNTLEIVGYPFDKFFNINERPEYREEEVLNHLKNATMVSLTDKKDGTLISVFNYNNKTYLTTNGSLENEYIDWAWELFNEKYKNFINNVPNNYTFIFEMIIPESKVVIDYGDMRKLFLIGIRNMKDYRFLSYEEMISFAKNNNLDITEEDDFSDVKTLIKKANSLREANKEGWVLKITEPSEDYFVKIKLAEYFELHRMVSRISFKRVYNLYTTGNLESYMAIATEDIKNDITALIEEIDIIREKYFNYEMNKAEELLKELNVTRNDVLNSKDILMDVIKRIGVGNTLTAIKNPSLLRLRISRATIKNFVKYQELVE